MSLTIDKCIQAWNNSLKQLKVKADIAFIGDSLTYYGDFTSVFPDKVVCNLGLRGDTILGMIDRIEQVKIMCPSRIYLMAGINDVATCTADEFKESYERLLMFLCNDLPSAGIILQSLLPVNDVEFTISCSNRQILSCNKIISSLAKSHNLRYLDLFSKYEQEGKLPKEMTIDGIHLRPKYYFKWYDLLKS